MKSQVFLVIVIATLLAPSNLLVNAEYKWDAEAGEWVLVEDKTPTANDYGDAGSGYGGGYDDEDDSEYDDEVEGSGFSDPDPTAVDTDDGTYDRGVYNPNKDPYGGGGQQPPSNNIDNSRNNYDNKYDNYDPYNSNSNWGGNNRQPPETPDTSQGGGGGVQVIDGPEGTAGGINNNGGVNPDTYEGTNRNPGDVWGGGSDKDSNRGGGSSSSSNTSTTFFAKSGTMAAVIMGAVVGLLCAILCVMFVVYRMRKKDEGSYALDEPKRGSPSVNSYSKPPNREFYA